VNLTTFTSRAAAALVAAVAGFSSYRHIYEVAMRAGEHQAVALALPLSIDGLIVVGTMALLDDKRAGRLPRQSARFALGFGVLATLAANVASAEPTWTARMVAAVPAVSFLLAVEVLVRTGKPRVVNLPPAPEKSQVTAPAGGKSATPANDLAEPASTIKRDVITFDPAKIEPANAEVETVEILPPSDPREAARELYRRSVAEGVPLSGAELGRRFGRSERWGRDRVAEVRQVVPLNGKINGKVAGGAA
jgi:hypothetical protein